MIRTHLSKTICGWALALAVLSVAPLAAQQQKPVVPAATKPARPAEASAAQEPKAATSPGEKAPDLVALLEAWVRLPPTQRDRAEKLDYIRHWLGSPMLRDQLGSIALDTAEPALARATALIAIGEEKPTNLGVFAFAMDDPDPTVRAGAAAALRPVLLDPAREPTARALLRRALLDRVPAVANRALESLGDRDAEALRDYLRTNPRKELAGVARQLLQLAESRGAPLVPRDSAGTLERDAGGVTLRYEPSQRFQEWGVSTGTLTARRGSAAPVVLARDVEVVRNVMPAVVSSDGRYVAYESGQHIRVRDLQTGADRDVGSGIAPRVAPLAPGFLYFEPAKTTLEGDRAVLDYKVVFAPFVAGATREVAGAAASARQAVNGNASPVRWARIVEGRDGFLLTGEGLISAVALPDLAGVR